MNIQPSREYFDAIIADMAADKYSDEKYQGLWKAIAAALEGQGCEMLGYRFAGGSTQSVKTEGELRDRSSGVNFRVETVLTKVGGGGDWHFSLEGFATGTDEQAPVRRLLATSQISQASHLTPQFLEYHLDSNGDRKHEDPESELHVFCQRFAFWFDDALSQ